MFSECDDTAMEDNEEEGGEEQAAADPVDDDLRRTISYARRDCQMGFPYQLSHVVILTGLLLAC
jgi:hypothetical protein